MIRSAAPVTPPGAVLPALAVRISVCEQRMSRCQPLRQGLLPMKTESHKIPLAQSYHATDGAVGRLVLYCKLPRHVFLTRKGWWRPPHP